MGRLALRRLTTTLLNEQEVNGKAVPVMPAKTGHPMGLRRDPDSRLRGNDTLVEFDRLKDRFNLIGD